MMREKPSPSIPQDILRELGESPLPASRLARRVRLHLDSLIESRGSGNPGIAQAPGFIDALRACLRDRGASNLPFLRLEHALLRAEIQLCAHEELPRSKAADVLARYREFMNLHGHDLFDSLFGWMEARIEDDLYIAQMEHFNSLCFEGLDAFLGRDKTMYEGVIAAIKSQDLDDRFTKDTLYAKLLGTLGQASGFLACMEPNPARAGKLFEEARCLLRKDLDCLPRGAEAWIHGASLVCTLEWRQGRAQEAIRWFAESLLLEKPVSPEDLALLSGPEAFIQPSNPQRDWIFINQVRILSLCSARREASVTPAQVEAALDRYLSLPDARYPRNLALKWLVYLAHDANVALNGRIERAAALLAPARTGTIDEAMRGVELALLWRVARNSGSAAGWIAEARSIFGTLRDKSSSPILKSSLAAAEALVEDQRRDTDPYSIASALPYYFA